MVNNPFPWRNLLEGQVSRLCVHDLSSGETRVVYETTLGAAEAPNWTSDGNWLVFNLNGELYRVQVAGGDTTKIKSGLELANNDHLLDPDGFHVYTSQNDGHIYRVPLDGGEPTRVTSEDDGLVARYLHGVSPDGTFLAHVGGPELATLAPYNIYKLNLQTGETTQLTHTVKRHDGAEFSPDGQWIYFNSERNSTIIGHCQLFRMRTDGTSVEQLTFDERVNWFPHISPDERHLAYLSFEPGTNGHPANVPAQIVITDDLLAAHPITRIDVFGGQGTINVPSWSPDSTQFAFADYPVLAADKPPVL
ncbi:MAG: biopolymer transporter Tol [Propionibacteriaceae bacterium]|jgi:Tol biopolymer transport system component|nr:biopolymer transporter Tol [Propionibacteriaceae bacterium]